MYAVAFTQKDINPCLWESKFFKYCNFTHLEITNLNTDADFVGCTFSDLDIHWGSFNIVSFIDCKFINCSFRGCNFPDSKFVECEFTDCTFEKDDNNSDCSFDDARAYACELNNCSGFNAAIIN